MEFTYSIRKATVKDAEDVISMIEELAEYENMLDQCKLTPEIFRKDGFGEDPAFHCIIAEAKTATGVVQTVGYALYYYIYSTFKGRNVYLEDVYVKKPYRKHGIGGDLMKTVAKIAIEKGCSQYRFACLGWNSDALDFYKSVGARDMTNIEDWHMLRFEKVELHDFASKLGKK
uniref:thialysine N-epsilon-acetyltransferase-like n=1 Tax=Styela clava TaxID=7725 RepID=UPI00193957F9|nr:thialysine N-epsilon-acetyltransferase-like [Styela clava]